MRLSGGGRGGGSRPGSRVLPPTFSAAARAQPVPCAAGQVGGRTGRRALTGRCRPRWGRGGRPRERRTGCLSAALRPPPALSGDGELGPLNFGPGAAGALPPCPGKKAAAGPRRRAELAAVPRTGAAPPAARRGRRCGGRPAVPPGPRRGQGRPAAAAAHPPRAGPGSAPASLRAASAGEPGLCPGQPRLCLGER